MAVLLRLLNILLGGRFPYHTVHRFFMFSPKGVLSPRTECSSAYSSKIRVNSGLGWKRARRALLHGPLELWQANSPVCVCVQDRGVPYVLDSKINLTCSLTVASKQISSPKVPSSWKRLAKCNTFKGRNAYCKSHDTHSINCQNLPIPPSHLRF